MGNKISDILENTLGVEVAYADDREISYLADIKLVMKSEIDFMITKTCTSEECDVQKIPFKKDDDVLVILKTKECCYSYQGKCTYIKVGRFFTLSVNYPVSVFREQKREFVRISINKDILLFVVAQNKQQMGTGRLLKNDFSINTRRVKSFDISGGGIAFYDTEAIAPKTNVLIDLAFIAPDLDGCRQTAQVLRCNKVKENDGLYLIGAQFVDPSFIVQQKINRFVFAQIREQAKKKKELR
ncbi:flagellar brake protein [Pectinatus haikarae]|uniref:C-di-GMP-binding flagellar brake protein YcgR n=1 Tax=Pectinatus haikarae TaxID=349096 RepID=A0ABT9Y6L3_9FIRM|nr:PilZ domain-containing protein [Pectinatus haikarae]MDQ0203278.1 c-di-GMP-binding flagellar brake protein YcgR [Pectinatus haikarae]